MIVLVIFSISFVAHSQVPFKPIKIVDEQVNNRLNIFALNNTLKDYDVTITIKGTGFREPRSMGRKIRVPGRSKVNLTSLVIERDKTPQYVYELEISDSLSHRVLKKEFELIKITPQYPITVIIPQNCISCDTLMSQLDESPFNYKVEKLAENESMRNQLTPYLRSSGFDPETMENPVVMIGGKMHVDINNYPDLIAKLEE